MASRMLRRSDAVRTSLAAARLYWRDPLTSSDGGEPVQRGDKVLECLRRAISLAASALPPPASPGLLLKCATAAADFLEAGVPTVS